MRLRVRMDGPWVVEHPETPELLVTLRPGDRYDDTDPLVARYRWAFEADNVESATAAPGARRVSARR